MHVIDYLQVLLIYPFSSNLLMIQIINYYDFIYSLSMITLLIYNLSIEILDDLDGLRYSL
jgi:hypothetical protein